MINTQALSRRLRSTVKVARDPGFGALRRAARAAIVIPLAFAFTDLLLREPQILIFVVFGCFSLLVISDFGGDPERSPTWRPRSLVRYWWRWARSLRPRRGLRWRRCSWLAS